MGPQTKPRKPATMKPTYQSLNSTRYTHHANARMQQRSIPEAVVELLLDYAHPTPVGGDAQSYRFTRATWCDAVSALGAKASAFAKYRNAYVVESGDGLVITAAWLY